MNDYYVMNETRDIYESLEPMESLYFVYNLLDLILNGLQYELETEKDKKNYNTLTTCLLSIRDIIKENDED